MEMSAERGQEKPLAWGEKFTPRQKLRRDASGLTDGQMAGDRRLGLLEADSGSGRASQWPAPEREDWEVEGQAHSLEGHCVGKRAMWRWKHRGPRTRPLPGLGYQHSSKYNAYPINGWDLISHQTGRWRPMTDKIWSGKVKDYGVGCIKNSYLLHLC